MECTVLGNCYGFYYFNGGIKTIVWTDTLQTTFMLVAVFLSIYIIIDHLGTNFSTLTKEVIDSNYSNLFFSDWNDRRFFLKQFLSGIFIAVVMTGLDQDMMQKNLSCRNLKDAQKNMVSLGFILIFVNLLFLFLGAILFIYSNQKGIEIPKTTDDLFPLIALKYLGPFAGIVFIIGLISAAYSSADSALTALTTSFSIDFLGITRRKDLSEKQKTNTRYIVHICIAIVLLFVIIFYRLINDKAIIDKLFTIAGYTYGPLLGLFAFGLFTKFSIHDKFVPVIAILSPLICYILSSNSQLWFNGYKFGFELLILNGLITFIGLLIISKSKTNL